jgi:hypothetical protein
MARPVRATSGGDQRRVGPIMTADAFLARQVEAMAGYGLPAEDIAQVLRMDVEELRRHYADELEDGRIKANSKVAENLYRKATGEGREAVTAAIFWLKTRAGWREVTSHEVQSDALFSVKRPGWTPAELRVRAGFHACACCAKLVA